MPKILISGVPGLDGEYPLDLTFTYRDFHDIKKIAGVRASELPEALAARDTDLIIALAAVALRRANKPFVVDQLLDAEMGGVSADFTDDEEEAEEASPPPSDSDGSSSPASSPSGSSTSASTEHSPETFPQLGSGIQPQASGPDQPILTT